LELATRLSETLADEVQHDSHRPERLVQLGFSKLDVLFGRKATSDILLHYDDISREGVEFRGSV
jgi:hypothetical protein